MNWSREIPAQDGYYWMRSDEAPKPIIIAVSGYRWGDVWFSVCGNDTPFRLNDPDFGHCEWIGPLELPV